MTWLASPTVGRRYWSALLVLRRRAGTLDNEAVASLGRYWGGVHNIEESC